MTCLGVDRARHRDVARVAGDVATAGVAGVAGDLVVEIASDGTSTRLDSTTLLELEQGWSSGGHRQLGRVFELARWGLQLPRREYARLERPEETSAPRWTDECVRPAVLRRLRERFDADDPVALTVPVWVKPASGDAVLSNFDLYLERDETLSSADDHFVRDGITIAGVRASLPKGIRAIVSVRDRELSELLGDSENPAHTEWQERSPKFKDRYRHGPFTLRYVKNAPREIVRLLTRPAEGRDFRLLQQLFSLEVPTEESLIKVKEPDDKAGAGDGQVEDDVEAIGRNRLFQLQKLQGGFRLKGTGDDGQAPAFVAVRVAYDMRRGNAFKQYQLPDFEMDKPPVRVAAEHATVFRCEQNFLVLKLERADFRLTVKGFDPHRDIRVKVLSGEELQP